MKENWHGQWRNATGAIEPTHRAAYRLFVGPLPSGMHVLHKCDNPICVNPGHLFLGTQADNAKDMWQKRRGRPGVSRGEDHGCAKLTAESVLQIRDSTESDVALAEKYKVSRTTIHEIRKRISWNHI
jgi:hypothetical protein